MTRPLYFGGYNQAKPLQLIKVTSPLSKRSFLLALCQSQIKNKLVKTESLDVRWTFSNRLSVRLWR